MIDKMQQEMPSTYTLAQIKQTAMDSESVMDRINTVPTSQKTKIDSEVDGVRFETISHRQQTEWMTEWDYLGYENVVMHTQKSQWEDMKQFSNLTEDEIGQLQQQGYDLNSKTEYEIYQLQSNQIEKEVQWNEEKEEKNNRDWAVQVAKIKEETDGLYKYALNEQGAMTIQDLYKESFNTPVNTPHRQNDYTYTKKDVESLITRNELSNTIEVQDAIQELLRMGKDITSENVTKYMNISNVIGNIDPMIAEGTINSVLMNGNRVNYNDRTIEDIKACLSKVDDVIIGQLIEEEKTVNLTNLREQMIKNTEKILENTRTKEVDLRSNEDILNQVNQIRAKLNVETAQRLSEKMPLESEELIKVAEGLRVVEQEIISESIKSTQIPDTEENRKILEETLRAVETLEASKGEAVYSYFKRSGTVSLASIEATLLNHEDLSHKMNKLLDQQGKAVTQSNKEDIVQTLGTKINTSTQKVLASKEVREFTNALYNQEGEVGKLLLSGEAIKDLGTQITNLQQSLKAQGIEWEGMHKQNIHRAIEEHPEQTKQLVETINQLEQQLGITKAQGGLKDWLNYPEVLTKIGRTLAQEELRVISTSIDDLGIEDTKENQDVLKDIIRANNEYKDLEKIKQLKNTKQMGLQLDKFLETAEEVATTTDSRFGEGIKKVENQIAQILERVGLGADEKNIEAAKALIQNAIDITPEAIKEVRDIMHVVDVISQELTPHKTAELIKEGINPYKASLENVADWLVENQNSEMKKSVAEAIVGLEEKGLITDAQKKGLVGVYRILNSVEADREKIMGYMYKNNLPITIEKLDEAIKYHNGGERVATQIDDTTGTLDTLSYTTQTARQLIGEAQEEMSQRDHLIKDFEEKVLIGLNKDIQQVLKDEITHILHTFEGKDVLTESMKDKLDVARQIAPNVLELMEKNNIPATLSNLYHIDQFEKNMDKYKKELVENEYIKEKLSGDLSEVAEAMEHVEEYIQTQKNESMFEGDLMGYKKYAQLEEVMQFQRELEEQHNIYVLPMMIEGQLKTVNFYLNKGQSKQAHQSEETKMIISYDTSSLGKIKAEVTLKEGRIDYRISTSKKENLQKLEQEKIFLKETLQNIGFEVNGEDYTNEHLESTTKQESSTQQAREEETSLFEMII